MSEFSIFSCLLSNISTVTRRIAKYNDDLFTIVVNNVYKIELPLIIAASISTKIAQVLDIDQTAKEYKIEIDTKEDIKITIDKIKRTIFGEKIDFENTEEKRIFALFGLRVGNTDFIKPYEDFLDKESKNLSVENTVKILNLKQTFEITNTEEEIKFLANKFEEMKNREEYIEYMSDPNNIQTIEHIIGSDSICINDEDSLLEFIIKISRLSNNNNAFSNLFNHVFLEYCSIDACNDFLNFIDEIIANISPYISCIRRRVSQPKIPLDIQYIEGRHKKKEEYYDEAIHDAFGEMFDF